MQQAKPLIRKVNSVWKICNRIPTPATCKSILLWTIAYEHVLHMNRLENINEAYKALGIRQRVTFKQYLRQRFDNASFKTR